MWGSNSDGQLNVGIVSGTFWMPNAFSLPRPAFEVRAGLRHACARDDRDDFYCWGWNASGQLGDGTTDTQPRATRVTAY